MPNISAYPLTLEEVKTWLRIDADYAYDDELLQSLVISETLRYEKRLNLGLVAAVQRTQQAVTYDLPDYGLYGYTTGAPTLDYSPVSPGSIEVKDYQGNVIDISRYKVIGIDYPQIRDLPTGSIIYYTSAGLNPFPEDLKRALKMRIALAYESRTGQLDETLRNQINNPDAIADQYSRNVF